MFLCESGARPWAVVMAGGDGTRLQQLTQRISGDPRPKQFCPFFGEKSLLAHTRDRLRSLFGDGQMVFLLSSAHRPFYDQELCDVPEHGKIVQPANRGTAVAMAVCLRAILEQNEDAMVVFFPSDHHYSNVAAFQESVAWGLRQIQQYPECILIVAAEAGYPEVEYGWIQPGPTLAELPARRLQRVVRFWEKPTLARARLLARRGCVWNTFVTMGRAIAFWEAIEATIPSLIGALMSSPRLDDLESLYEQTAPIDFSRSVLSRLPGRLLVLRDGESGWTDLGNQRRVVQALTLSGMRPPWLDEAAAEFPQAVYGAF